MGEVKKNLRRARQRQIRRIVTLAISVVTGGVLVIGLVLWNQKENLTVYAGEWSEIEFPQKFDYIIITGVMERIGGGSNNECDEWRSDGRYDN